MNRPERNHRNYISANRAPLASDPLNNSNGDAIDITNVKYYTKRTKKPIVNLKQYIRHYESIFHRPPPRISKEDYDEAMSQPSPEVSQEAPQEQPEQEPMSERESELGSEIEPMSERESEAGSEIEPMSESEPELGRGKYYDGTFSRSGSGKHHRVNLKPGELERASQPFNLEGYDAVGANPLGYSQAKIYITNPNVFVDEYRRKFGRQPSPQVVSDYGRLYYMEHYEELFGRSPPVEYIESIKPPASSTDGSLRRNSQFQSSGRKFPSR